MEYIATFLEGVITFASPCLLPMLPLFIAYFTGDANEAAARKGGGGPMRALLNAAGFALGFSIVFVALGLLAGAFGRALEDYATVVNVVCGIVVIVFGLHYAGILNVPLLQRTFKIDRDVRPHSFLSAVLLGIVFSIGWTPCVGVFLGSALALAAVESSALRGMALLLCYSAGLAIPFLVSAVAIERLSGAFDVIKRHYREINLVCGILLIAMGILMATGQLSALLHSLA